MINQTLSSCYKAITISFFIFAIFDIIFIIPKKIFQNKAITFCYDLFFFLTLGTALPIILFYCNDGQIRWYYILSELIGIVAYYLSIAKIIRKVLDVIIAQVNKFLKFIIKISKKRNNSYQRVLKS